MITRTILSLAVALLTVRAAIGQAPMIDDSQLYYVVVLTQEVPTPACQRLQAIVRDPAMQSVTRGTKLYPMTTGQQLYRLRYATSLPAAQAPTVALVRPDGGVLVKYSGPSIPPAVELAERLREYARADLAVRANQPIRYSLLDEAHQWRIPRVPIPDTIDIRPTLAPTIQIAPSAIVVVTVIVLAGGSLLAIVIALVIIR